MKGLVLAGGGVRGAYEVGVLRYLLHDLEIHFDVIAGVSVGALNAAVLSQFNKGQEKQAYLALESIWLSIRNKDVYRPHFPLGIFQMPFMGSVYDTSPLKNTIEKHISPYLIHQSDKTFIIGATDYAGQFKEFRREDYNVLEAIRASAAIPILFPPVMVNNTYYMDGGVKEIVPVISIVKHGCNDILTIIPSPKIPTGKIVKKPNLKESITRAVDISLSVIDDKNFFDHPIIRPGHTLTTNALDFNSDLIKSMIAQGYQDAQTQYDS